MTAGRAIVLLLCAGLAWSAWAGGADTTAPSSPVVRQPMDKDQPMVNNMKRPGMIKGDVGKAERRHHDKMKKMLEQEQRSMPPESGDDLRPRRGGE